jgi:two-component system, LytTR family, response regulator
MNCLIVDDNKLARIAISQILSQFDFIHLVGECENSFEAMSLMAKEKVDLILLDIEMPKMSGLEFLKSNADHPLVILVTAKKDYAFEAYDYNIVDYILKPLETARLAKSLSKALELYESKNRVIDLSAPDNFFIKERGVYHKIKAEDILYVHALGDYISIYIFEKRYTVHMNLKEFESRVDKNKFFRVHRSYIIALDKIDTIEESTAFVQGIAIPIGDVYRSSLLKKINLL